MSDSTPDVTVDASKTVDNVEETTKNEEKTVDELKAELDKKSKVAEDKHNFALKTETEKKELLERLSKYEEAEKIAELKKQEDAWEYEEIKKNLSAQAEAEKLRAEQLETEITELRAEKLARQERDYETTLSKLPEDKQAFYKEKLADKSVEDKAEILGLIVSQFAPSESFGKVPETKVKKTGQLEELQAKLDKQGYLAPSEYELFKKLKK